MQGLGKVLIRSDQIQPNHPCCAVATTTKAIQQFPDTLIAFLKGLNEATTFVLTNAQDTAQILSSPDYTGVEAAIEAHALPNMLFLAKPDETFISGTENFAKEMKKLTAVGLTKDHDRNDLFDLTLINKAIP
jgi:NitT/TauT family transport system substrate-binding protein